MVEDEPRILATTEPIEHKNSTAKNASESVPELARTFASPVSFLHFFNKRIERLFELLLLNLGIFFLYILDGR
jgi:hypothetical protein